MAGGSLVRLALAACASVAAGIHLGSLDGGAGCASLTNMGTHFTVGLEVGTPAQSFSVVADTGSNSLIVPSCVCQEKGLCGKEDRCFRGTEASSSFHLEQGEDERPIPMVLSFGSGQIKAVVAQERVSVGGVSRRLGDGLLLMTDRRLDIAGQFEGILGLGLPQPATNWTALDEQAAANSPMGSVEDRIQQIVDGASGQEGEVASPTIDAGGLGDGAGGAGAQLPDQVMRNILRAAVARYNGTRANASAPRARGPHRDAPKGFLEQVNISRFSMCFNDGGADGVLRLGGPPLGSHRHGGMGTAHWGVDFRGISVGNATAPPVNFCRSSQMVKGQASPCGAIPDSGTTLMMGPAEQISLLLDDICDRWPRCRSNFTRLLEAEEAASKVLQDGYGVTPFDMRVLNKSDVLQLLLQDCDRWMTEEVGTDGMPDLHFHIRGSNSTRQALKIPPHAYLVEYVGDNAASAYKLLEGVGTIPTDPRATRGAKKVCAPAFGVMDYDTRANGPVWILGTPLFYEYVVSYDMAASPPAMSFASQQQSACGSCEEARAGVNLASTAPRNRAGPAQLRPRRAEGPPRVPTVDVTRPL